MIISGKREAYYDNIKCILIILVVVGHFADFALEHSDMLKSLFLFIYSFHMPLFIFLSGLFCKSTISKGDKTAVRVVFFFMLYVLMKILTFAVAAVFDQQPQFPLFTEGGAPWYLFATAVFYAVTYAVRNVNKKALLIFSVVLAVVAGYDPNIGDRFVLLRIMVFYPYFVAGWAMDRDSLKRIMSSKKTRIAGAICVVVFALACLILIDVVYNGRFIFSGRHNYEAFERYAAYGPILRIAGYIVGVVMCFAVMAVVPQKHLPVISTMGQRTLGIYFFHRPILSVLIYTGVLEKLYFYAGYTVGNAIWIVMAVILSFVLALPVFNRIVNFESKLYIETKRT